MALPVSALTCKALGSCHLNLQEEKKVKKMKTNEFSLTYQRIEITRHSATPKSGETGEYRESDPRLDPFTWGESHWRHKLVGTVNNNFDKLLKAKCRPL